MISLKYVVQVFLFNFISFFLCAITGTEQKILKSWSGIYKNAKNVQALRISRFFRPFQKERAELTEMVGRMATSDVYRYIYISNKVRIWQAKRVRWASALPAWLPLWHIQAIPAATCLTYIRFHLISFFLFSFYHSELPTRVSNMQGVEYCIFKCC